MTQQIPIDIAKDSLIPIIVGVTGHRYITSRNEPVIRVVFEELDRKYPNTPIVVLSPLAEGSDRLVSQIALETPRKTGAANSLICPLPLTLEEYEKDFNPESKKEFQNLLNKASGYFSFPSVMHSSNDREVERRMQYEQVGKYIARHSHILIALWDGEDKSENIGGTSHIVKLRHENKLDLELHPFEEIEIGPIYHFPIKKKENGVVEIGSKRDSEGATLW